METEERKHGAGVLSNERALASFLRALDMVEERMDGDIGLEDMARAACFSPYYFSRLFSQATGHAPYDYLMRRRVAAAAEKVVSGPGSLTEIALNHGFGGSDSFARAFRRCFGILPSEARTSGCFPRAIARTRISKSYVEEGLRRPWAPPWRVGASAARMIGSWETDPDLAAGKERRKAVVQRDGALRAVRAFYEMDLPPSWRPPSARRGHVPRFLRTPGISFKSTVRRKNRMTNRERALAVLRYRSYDRLPIVHFGFWRETLEKWRDEGHLGAEEIRDCGDRSPAENRLAAKLGFDFNWHPPEVSNNNLFPWFPSEVLERLPDGFRKVRTSTGIVELHKDGAGTIPSQVDYLLKGRKEWEEHYLPRLRPDDGRIRREYLESQRTGGGNDAPVGLHCGSLYGDIRGWLGVEALAYLQADDPGLFAELIETKGELCYRMTERALASGVRFDFGHFWEDICFKNGPLVNPRVFEKHCGPWYRKITDLLGRHGISIVSLDCDGCIDALIPTWTGNGVNTMFPIEVGTWGAEIGPWRAKYGKGLLGVGGMDKRVFARDRRAVDTEVERLKPLVALGGFLPCPDHRIPPDAGWDNVRYYCERMRRTFGG